MSFDTFLVAFDTFLVEKLNALETVSGLSFLERLNSHQFRALIAMIVCECNRPDVERINLLLILENDHLYAHFHSAKKVLID